MAQQPKLPPLMGDEKGRYRVVIVGNSGAGKSTTGKIVASILNLPFISMDHLHWSPGWKIRPVAEFEDMLKTKLSEASNGWVIDGNYYSRQGPRAFGDATDVIWLDPPFMFYFPRLIKRTIYRLFGYGIPCAPGCNESWRSVFLSKESIIWWCIANHSLTRARFGDFMTRIGVVSGSEVDRRVMRRIGGCGGELSRWLADLEVLVTTKRD